LTALVSAHVHFSVAAELAEATASKPGSFATAFIDALDVVDEISLRSRAKVHPAVLIP
jgi:hydroxyethylthiazole kinase